MSKHFLDIIQDDGYVLTEGKYLDFNTMEKGRMYNVFEKEGCEKILWGLSEYRKPPTLVYPRPKMEKYTSIEFYTPVSYDDLMNECLNKFSHKDIYDGIINEWTFNLDEQKIIK